MDGRGVDPPMVLPLRLRRRLVALYFTDVALAIDSLLLDSRVPPHGGGVGFGVFGT